TQSATPYAFADFCHNVFAPPNPPWNTSPTFNVLVNPLPPTAAPAPLTVHWLFDSDPVPGTIGSCQAVSPCCRRNNPNPGVPLTADPAPLTVHWLFDSDPVPGTIGPCHAVSPLLRR